jgi:hypothetical protein
MTTELHSLQEKIWRSVFENEKKLGLSGTLLCGGTALARFYLDHRISYDLDFFTPSRFDPEALLVRLGKSGINIKDPVMETRTSFCRQLTGLADVGGQPIKIDFVEDISEGMFDSAEINGARTEVIGGLYHRKIRTVSGLYLKDGRIGGGRQTARDLFDLYVLSQSVEPLSGFVDQINRHGANIPVEGLRKGILGMPWIDLMDDFDELEKHAQWKDCCLPDVRRLLEKEAISLQDLEDDDSRHGPS